MGGKKAPQHDRLTEHQAGRGPSDVNRLALTAAASSSTAQPRHVMKVRIRTVEALADEDW
jgi:hypothetical protein